MRNWYVAGEKYWKISSVVMVITSVNIGFITSSCKATSDKSNIFTSDDQNHK